MKRFLLVFLILLSFFSPGITFAHSATVIIKMTPNGFEPQNATVDQNSIVLFSNEDQKDRWPASNVHPTHDLYPEFDPQKGVKSGESWAFKPKKVGSWKYHDHLNPHIRGTLVVVGEKGVEQEGSKVDWLNKLKNYIVSFWLKFTNPVVGKQTKDPVVAWQDLKDKYKGQSGSLGNIHDLAHLAGGLIYEKLGFSGLSKCSSDFAFGCYHGFLDKAFEKNLDKINEAESACKTLGEGGPFASCIHGIGHGVASFYQTADLKKALSTCRRLLSGQEYCFDGVFMEFVRSAPLSFFKKEDPLYPCNVLEQEFGYAYSQACGRNQPSLLMSRFSMGFDEVIGVCIASSSKPFKQSCFDSLGFSLASTGDVNQIIPGCQKIGDGEFISTCIKSAAGELIFQEVPGWESKWQQVCNASLDSKLCLENGERLIKEYGRVPKVSFDNYKNEEDPNIYIRDQLKKCYENNGRDGCYKKAADTLYSFFGLKKTLQLLANNENYQEVYARCHEVTHYLSRSEYERLGSIAKVYSQCDSTCHGGCYHGTLEAYLKSRNLDGDGLKKEFSKICGKREDYSSPLVFNECFHGLGHAAMFVLDMELKESLKLCDTIGNQEYRERCYTGVFMENSSSSTSFDHASIYIKTDDPFYPCNSLEEKYLPLCWQYQSSYFSIISKQDWKKVSDLCLQIPQNYQDQCFRTIGTNQVGYTRDLSKMKADCDLMPTEHFQDICVLGVVSSMAYRYVGDLDKMIQFCNLVDDNHQETCFKQMGAGFLDWSLDKDLAKRNCAKIPNQNGHSWCMNVIVDK